MKILIVGSNNVWAIENTYIKYLQEKNEVTLFNAHGLFLEYYHKNIYNKIIFRLGLSIILFKINKNLITLTQNYQPDVVWVFKGMEIFPKTLKKLRSANIKLVNYNGDHPFNYEFRGSGNKNVLNSIPLYDHHFSYSKKIIKSLKEIYQVPSSWLPYAYHFSSPPKINTENKICFIGNPDKDRSHIIQLLIDHKIPIAVYGNNWDKFNIQNKYLTIYPAIYSDEFIKITQQYRIHLNIFRSQNEDSHNMRTFEMPALGSIMLAPKSKEHIELFKEGEEAFYYKNDTDFLTTCKKIMALSDSEAYQIQLNAYQRSITSNYSYKDRSEQVLNVINKITKQ